MTRKLGLHDKKQSNAEASGQLVSCSPFVGAHSNNNERSL